MRCTILYLFAVEQALFIVSIIKIYRYDATQLAHELKNKSIGLHWVDYVVAEIAEIYPIDGGYVVFEQYLDILIRLFLLSNLPSH